MNYLYLDHVTKYYADKILFEDVSLGINQGQKYALVAKNGAGKTSLLNVIAGLDEPDDGKAKLHPNIKIGYLHQEPEFNKNESVIDNLFSYKNETTEAIKRYEMAIEANSHTDNADTQKELHDAIHEMDTAHAWDYESKVKQVLTKLKLTDFDRPVSILSGGQQKRLALARILLLEPDLMILDEPTNHLDIEMIEWLEKYLQQPGFTLFLVTHDRYFLDRICDAIVELDQGKLTVFNGSYSYYLEKKSELDYNRSKEIGKAKSLVRRDLDWINRMPKARGTKDKARVSRFKKNKSIASSGIKEDKTDFQVVATRLGSKILEIKSVSKSYDDLVLINKFTYSFKKFEKIGIIGNNGTGKTTLLNLIMGEVQPDSGTIKQGATLKTGYFSQENPDSFVGKRVLDIVKEVAEMVTLKNGKTLGAGQFLQLFQFTPESQFTYYESLSGGEKRRLNLVRVLMSNPNFLILDEPTNDLDLPTLQTLELFLEEYPGCVIVVSHDRFFMDKITDHLFVFKGNGEIIDFPGNYTQYRLEVLSKQQAKNAQKKTSKPNEKKVKEKVKLSYKEQLEYDRLTLSIDELEIEKSELAQLLDSGETDHEKLIQWSAEFEKVSVELEKQSDRWLELSEFV